MKIICKVYPSENACCGCVDEQLRGDRVHMDCNECRKKIPEYEVLQFGHNFLFGDWAIVLGSDGTVEKVKMSRVKEVKTLHDVKGTACHGSAIHDIRLKNV